MHDVLKINQKIELLRIELDNFIEKIKSPTEKIEKSFQEITKELKTVARKYYTSMSRIEKERLATIFSELTDQIEYAVQRLFHPNI